MKYQKGSFVVLPNKNVIKGKSPFTQAVYLWICDHSDEEGECFPSIQRLADESGMSYNQVQREIENLESLGIIEKINRKKEGTKQNLTNLYQIMIVNTPSPHAGGTSPTPGVTPSPTPGVGTVPTLLTTPTIPDASASDALSFEEWKSEHGYTTEYEDEAEITRDSHGKKVSESVARRTYEASTGVPSQGTKLDAMKELVAWAIQRRGFSFTSTPKQYLAITKMKTAGIGPNEIKNRWVDMEGDDFWRDKGFDFMSVASTFDKKR